MGAVAAAGRSHALDFRQARALGRPPPDGPSRSGDDRGGTRSLALGRTGLWADRRPLPAYGGPRRRGRAQAPAADAGMDQREDLRRLELAELRASTRRDAQPRGARGYRPGRSGDDATRL